MSRPTKLDETKCREIIALAYCGLSRRAIAEYIECAPNTIENTARRNPAFAEALRAATSRFVRENCRTVMQQSRTSWRAAAWSLERMQPHNFARRPSGAILPAEHTRQFNKLTAALTAALPPECRETIARESQRVLQELRQSSRNPDAWDSPLPLGEGQGEGDDPGESAIGGASADRCGGVEENAESSQTSTPSAASDTPPAADADSSSPPPFDLKSIGKPRDNSLVNKMKIEADQLSDQWPPPVHYRQDGLNYLDMEHELQEERLRPRTAREYRRMRDDRIKEDLLRLDVERLLADGRRYDALRLYTGATGRSMEEAGYFVDDLDDARDKANPPPQREDTINMRQRYYPPIIEKSLFDAAAQSAPLLPPAATPSQPLAPAATPGNPPAPGSSAPGPTEAARPPATTIASAAALVCGLLLSALLLGASPRNTPAVAESPKLLAHSTAAPRLLAVIDQAVIEHSPPISPACCSKTPLLAARGHAALITSQPFPRLKRSGMNDRRWRRIESARPGLAAKG